MIKIISGAQSGVDQASLDTAIEYNINYDGWVPKTGAENLNIDDLLSKYPKVKITKSKEPAIRTIFNIMEADVLINIVPYWSRESQGTALGVELGEELEKPALNIFDPENYDIQKAVSWVKEQESKYVNLKIGIGGPRETQCENCYKYSKLFLEKLFKELVK